MDLPGGTAVALELAEVYADDAVVTAPSQDQLQAIVEDYDRLYAVRQAEELARVYREEDPTIHDVIDLPTIGGDAVHTKIAHQPELEISQPWHEAELIPMDAQTMLSEPESLPADSVVDQVAEEIAEGVADFWQEHSSFEVESAHDEATNILDNLEATHDLEDELEHWIDSVSELEPGQAEEIDVTIDELLVVRQDGESIDWGLGFSEDVVVEFGQDSAEVEKPYR